MSQISQQELRRETKVVSTYAKAALKEYKESEGGISSLLYFVSVWPHVEEKFRKVLGKKILGLLNKEGIKEPILVREVLQYVGTPVCTCEEQEAWGSILTFLEPDQLLSVKCVALEAAVRLLKHRPRDESWTQIHACVPKVELLLHTEDSETTEVAQKFLNLTSSY